MCLINVMIRSFQGESEKNQTISRTVKSIQMHASSMREKCLSTASCVMMLGWCRRGRLGGGMGEKEKCICFHWRTCSLLT